jgi:hypothetical protein
MGIAVFAASMAPTSSYGQGPFTDIQNKLAAISAQLNQLGGISTQLNQLLAQSVKVGDLYVPFKVEIAGGLCDSAASPSSNPKIVIDSDGTDTFVVTSILVKRGFMNPVDFLFLSVNGVEIDGTIFDTRTGNLFGPLGGEFAVMQSADILGMPVRMGGLITDSQPGGNVPHQIVAEGEGAQDIRVDMFCRSDNQDMNIETVLVAGWKKPGDTVSVSYVPGH